MSPRPGPKAWPELTGPSIDLRRPSAVLSHFAVEREGVYRSIMAAQFHIVQRMP